MKLDNVDPARLQAENLPKFEKCPCELCDDGCFDRAGYKHHPECRRKISQRSRLPRSVRCPLTHYQATFLAAINPSGLPEDHRRQACPPPPDNHIPTSFRNASMSGVTSQRDDYKAPPIDSIKPPANQSAKPTQKDNLSMMRAVPMETKTQYQVEYVEKPVIPISMRPLKDPTKDSAINITDSTAPVASQTTTRSHFKSWQSSPSLPFMEPPPVAGYVLFPTTQRRFSTSSGTTFQPYINAAPAKPILRLESSGNLRISGPMDLRTTNREDYISHPSHSARSTPGGKKLKSNQDVVYTRRRMDGVTQTSYDFRAYPEHRPPVPVGMEPFLSQFKIGSSLTAPTSKSQYRTDFEGIDTSRHPREPAAGPKDHQRPYVAPVIKMDTMTVTQRDFQPLDISTLPRIKQVPMKGTLSVGEERAPMENTTMSRFHYQPYENVKIRRYGDPLPSVYIPSFEKFEGRTTNKDTYQGRPGPPAKPKGGEVKIITKVGKHDHNTNYRLDYHPHGLSMCAAKAHAIAELKREAAAPVSSQ